MTTKLQFRVDTLKDTFTGEKCPPLAATKLIQTIKLSATLEKVSHKLEENEIEVALKNGLWKSLTPEKGVWNWHLAKAGNEEAFEALSRENLLKQFKTGKGGVVHQIKRLNAETWSAEDLESWIFSRG